MTLKIHPPDVRHFQDFTDPMQEGHDEKADHRLSNEDHVTRRVYCDGCGLSLVYAPEKWVFERPQVQSWIDEHKNHPDEPLAVGETPKNTRAAK